MNNRAVAVEKPWATSVISYSLLPIPYLVWKTVPHWSAHSPLARLPRLTCKPALQCLTWWLMNLFIIAMWVAILLSCSRLYVVNSRILSNEIIFKGSCPLVVCANMGLILCPIPLDNYTVNPFKILFKYFLRYFISLLKLYSFGMVLVWVVVDIY